MAIRLFIADDHGVIRAGLRALFQSEAEIELVGEAGDGEETLQRVVQVRPDIILLDITMPGLNGIEVTRQLRTLVPQSRILILTLHEGVSMLREAIGAGASGYIPKRAVDVELLNAIHCVARGEMYVHPSMTQALLKDMSPQPSPPAGEFAALTRREIEVLRLVAQGYTNRQIAKTLTLSVRTVDTHRANLMNKLGLNNREELVRYAIQHKLLNAEPGPPDQ